MGACFLVSVLSTAQSTVGIGTTTPAASAALDVSSTTRGLLPPRMTAAQRNAIASPANGLIVFDTDSAALMLRSAGGWRRLTTTATPGGFWQTSDGHIFNTNTGNVGIGVGNPSAKLELAGSMIVRGSGNPATPPFIQFYQGNGTFVSSAIGVQNDSMFGVLTSAGWALNVHNNNGRVGIGTSTPASRLDVSNGNVLFRGYLLNYPQVPAPVPFDGAGGRMIWYAEKAAFRVGHTGAGNYYNPSVQSFVGTLGDPNAWNTDSIGQYSFAAGASPMAKGEASVALGYGTKATFLASTAMGFQTQALGRMSTALGEGTIAKGDVSVALGKYNDTADNAIINSARESDRVFQIGNGFMTNNGPFRRTAFSILRNGFVGIGAPDPKLPLEFSTTLGLGKKISLYRGATGDAGFGVWPSELRVHSDFSGAAISFGFDDLTNGFTERFRMTPAGDLRMAGDRQSIQFVSNGNAVNEPMIRMFEGGTQNPSRMVIAHSPAFRNWGLEYNDTIDQFNFKGGGDARVSIQLASGFVGISEDFPDYRLDVKGRIRLQGLGNEANSAGIWYSRIADKSEAFFAGMRNDSSWGIYSNNAFSPDWQLNMNARTGYIGLGNFNANAPLHFNNAIQNRKVILYENANNEHQYYGFGINNGVLRYQTDATTADHVFYAGINATSSVELMRIKGNGAVGFNTDDPNVYGHGGANQFVEIRNRAVGGNAQSHLILSTSGTAGSMGGVTWSTRDFVGEKKAAFIGAAYEAGTNDALFQVLLRNNGNLAQRFRISSNGNAWLQGTLTQNSDATLKTSIEPIVNATDLLQQLHGYRYQWKDENADADIQLGLLAQEVQKVLPELVKEGDNGKLGVNYSGLIPVLLVALKEQQVRIAELEKKLEKILSK